MMRCSSGIKEDALKLLGILSWWRAKLKQKTYGLRNTKDKLMSEKEEITNLSTVLWGQADSSLKSLAKRWFLLRKPVAAEWSIHTGISATDWGQRAGINLFQTLRNKSRRTSVLTITCSLSRHRQWLPSSCSWALDSASNMFCMHFILSYWLGKHRYRNPKETNYVTELEAWGVFLKASDGCCGWILQ